MPIATMIAGTIIGDSRLAETSVRPGKTTRVRHSAAIVAMIVETIATNIPICNELNSAPVHVLSEKKIAYHRVE